MSITKYIYQSVIGVLFVALLFVSCEREIEFKGAVTAPKPVLNSLLLPDSVVAVQLSKTRFVLSNAEEFEAITDAQVSLYVNGELQEQLNHLKNGNYKSSYYPLAGDAIRIEASGTGFDKIVAETVMLTAPNIVLTDSIVDIIEEEFDNPYPSSDGVKYSNRYINRYMNLQFTLSDAADEDNYYFIKGMRYFSGDDSDWQFNERPLDIELSEALKSSIEGNDDFFNELFGDDDRNGLENVFTDRFINGKDIMFELALHDYIDFQFLEDGIDVDEGSKIKQTVKYEIEIGQLSKDYFHYLVSTNKALNAEDMGFLVEPVMIHSNVENGVGMLGAYNVYRFVEEFESYYPY